MLLKYYLVTRLVVFATLLSGLCLLLFSCRKESDKISPVVSGAEFQSPLLRPVTVNVNKNIGGFYVATPARYSDNAREYPLLVFLHGAGQYGNGSYDLPLLLNEAIPQLLEEGKFPASFKSRDTFFSFIVLAPQFRVEPFPSDVVDLIKFGIKSYRINQKQIYLVGLSHGGRLASDVAAKHPDLVAAVVATAGVSSTDVLNKSKSIAQANIPVWAFHNKNDQIIPYSEPGEFIRMINSYSPSSPSRFTLFPETPAIWGHDAWTKATNPDFREDGINIYEWMLQYRK